MWDSRASDAPLSKSAASGSRCSAELSRLRRHSTVVRQESSSVRASSLDSGAGLGGSRAGPRRLAWFCRTMMTRRWATEI